MTLAAPRTTHLVRAIRLEILTVVYMAFEAAAALYIGFSTSSASLETFGMDSLIEIGSGLVLWWRLRVELRGGSSEAVERVERRAARMAGFGLFLVAVYIAIQSVYSLVSRAQPTPSPAGIALAILSLATMTWLARLKLEAAHRISSRALRADAFETLSCAYLSFTLLLGLAGNYLFRWWWADPLAALVMLYFIVGEAREAFAGASEQDV